MVAQAKIGVDCSDGIDDNSGGRVYDATLEGEKCI
jgi:hypothetical protein